MVLPILLVALVVAAPTLLSTSSGRSYVLGRINNTIAPSRVELGAWSLSWNGSTRLTNFTLLDPSGKALLSAREAVLDRGVWQLLANRPDYGTLTLSGAKIDIERKGDGSIDVLESIAPLTGGDPNEKSNPKTAITVKIVHGTLKVRSPELTEPLVAKRVRASVQLSAGPKPLKGVIELENEPGQTLRIEASYDHRAKSPDLAADVKSAAWPLAIARAGIVGTATLDGDFHVSREKERWNTAGKATLHRLDATGPTLSGDRLRLTRVVSDWDLSTDKTSWIVKTLEIKTHIGSISGRRTPKADGGGSAILVGRFDLAALAKELPHTLRLRPGLVVDQGTSDIRAEILETRQTKDITLRATLPSLKAHDGERAIVLDDPSILTAHVVHSADGVKIDRAACTTGFCDLSASGDMDAGIRLKGDLDLGVMQEKLGAMIDFGTLKLAGRAAIAGLYRKHADVFHCEFQADVADLSIAGMTAETIAERQLQIESNAEGPSDRSGLPKGWSKLKLTVRGTDLSLNADAQRAGDQIDVLANAATRFVRDDRAGRAEGHIRGRLSPAKLFTFDTAQILVRPLDRDSQAAEIAIAAMGHFDAAKGILSLSPIDGAGAGMIAPVEGGLTLDGLDSTGGALSVAGGLTADMRRIDRAIAYWTSSAPRGVAGRLTAGLDARRESNGLVRFDLRLDSPDAVLPGATNTQGPLSIASKGVYQSAENLLEVASLRIRSYYGALDADGSLRDPGGAAIIDAQGRLTPNWKLVDALMASAVEPHAVLKAEARPFRVKGPLNGEDLATILRGLDAEAGVDMSTLSAFGVRVGPSPVILRCAGGRVTLDPIETTINSGKLILRPVVALNDSGDIAIHLNNGSAIIDASINEEVSTRVLSYAAPVLNEAAQARGHLTVGIVRAEIPVIDHSGREVDLAGNLKFQQVTFGPGPIVRQILGVMGQKNTPELRLDQTVPFWVAHGEVGQKGLTVIVSPKVQVAIDGSVGFDGAISLLAAVPLNASMIGDNQLVNEIVDGTRVGLPIGGTLSRPVIDRRALQLALREAGRAMVKRGVQAETRQLLNRALGGKPAQPADPGRPRGLANEALDMLLPR
jgi:translocation and assembly module TamB